MTSMTISPSKLPCAKLCQTCETLKPPKEFYVDIRAPGGLTSKCKQCQKDYARKYRLKNLGRIQEYDRLRAKSRPSKVRSENAGQMGSLDRMLESVKEQPGRSVSEYAADLGIGPSRATDLLRSLVNEYQMVEVADGKYRCRWTLQRLRKHWDAPLYDEATSAG